MHDPSVQLILVTVAGHLREAVSKLVLTGLTQEAQGALALLQGTENLLARPSISTDLSPDEVAILTTPKAPGCNYDKIGAIKAYRTRTNAGLLEAKTAVEDYMRRTNLT